jgi:hypothetical protein
LLRKFAEIILGRTEGGTREGQARRGREEKIGGGILGENTCLLLGFSKAKTEDFGK